MSSSKMRSICLSSLLVVLAACSPSEQDGENNAAAETIPLEGTSWQLVQVTVLGGFVFAPEDPSEYGLTFRSENRLTGTSDCNTITGSWQQENTELHFDPFSSSRSLCAPGSLHNNLVLYLRDTAGHSLRDGHLVLTTTTAGVEIEFAPSE